MPNGQPKQLANLRPPKKGEPSRNPLGGRSPGHIARRNLKVSLLAVLKEQLTPEVQNTIIRKYINLAKKSVPNIFVTQDIFDRIDGKAVQHQVIEEKLTDPIQIYLPENNRK